MKHQLGAFIGPIWPGYMYKCNDCHVAIHEKDKFCKNCGKEFSEQDRTEMIESSRRGIGLVPVAICTAMFFAVMVAAFHYLSTNK